MQRRSGRGQQLVEAPQEKTKDKEKDKNQNKERDKGKDKDIEVKESDDKTETPSSSRRRGRPRKKSEPKVDDQEDVEEDTKIKEDDSKVNEKEEAVLNARGRPARQRKKNRFYYNEEEEDDDKSPSPRSKPSAEKKIKLEMHKSEKIEILEPLQILVNVPSDLKVTPIMSESNPEDFDTPVVHAKKSSVKLIMSSPSQKVKAEPGITKPSIQVTKFEMPKPRSVYGRTSLPPKLTPMTKVEILSKTESNKMEISKKSDYYSFIRFFANVKTKAIMPDRWGINGVMFDPVRKMKTFTISETEISAAGDLCIKKCIQVFEDLSLRIVILGQDLTRQIDGLKKIHYDTDVPNVISRVLALKICTGVKNFGTQDLNYHPSVKKKGNCYFSNECQTVLSSNYVGALCPPCNKLRNAVRRRRIKTKQEREKSLAQPNVKKVPSTFGRAMYSFLNALMTDDKSKRGNIKGKDVKLIAELKSELGTPAANGRRRSGTVIKAPRKTKANSKPNYKLSIKKENSLSGALRGPLTIIDPATGLAQSVLPQGLIEYLTMAGGDNSNIVYQNGTEFAFADGQEYELVNDPNQAQTVPSIGGGGLEENTIQIIELDDQTMAQFAAHNISMSGMGFYDPSNIQVTEIDPNDENTIFKVINPDDIFLQEQDPLRND